MKKSKSRNKAQSTRSKRDQTSVPEVSKDRRATLRLLRNGIIGVAVVGGAGVFSVNAVRATISEQDLTRIGNGIPTIVQVHDPSCSMCTELQRETRRALRSFDDGTLNYLVSNITTAEGNAFAAQQGVGHVTLLLFDGAGRRVQVLEGVRRRDELEALFRTHLAPAS